MPPRYFKDCFTFSLAAILFLRKFLFLFGFIISSWTVHELWWWTVHELLFLNSSWTVMMNYSWTFVHELASLTFYKLFVNCSWTIFGFIISSWTVHELMMNCSWTFIYVNFSGTIDELFMNYFFFITSSWTVHQLWWWTVHEL